MSLVTLPLLHCYGFIFLFNGKEVLDKNSSLFFSNNIVVSHLLFTDDILVFGKDNILSILEIKCILSNLKDINGLSINIDKSFIYFSKNIHEASNLSNLLGLQMGTFLVKYLGIPLKDGHLKSPNFYPHLDKIFA